MTDDEKILEDVSSQKLSLRKRIHYWFCDCLNIVSYDDYADLYDEYEEMSNVLDSFMQILNKMSKVQKAQAVFDKCVAERLHMDKVMDDIDFERGMYV